MVCEFDLKKMMISYRLEKLIEKGVYRKITEISNLMLT
jgi:hypothetical protein